jgi:bacterioferritin-associated ferredoxin
MYLCIGKAVTEGQIREVISRGLCTRKELVHCLGVGRDCGKCNGVVRELVDSCTPNRSHEPALLGIRLMAVA